MFRFPLLADFLGWELIDVAKAMADGSYWKPVDNGDARDCGWSSPNADWG